MCVSLSRSLRLLECQSLAAITGYGVDPGRILPVSLCLLLWPGDGGARATGTETKEERRWNSRGWFAVAVLLVPTEFASNSKNFLVYGLI